jgi:ABC-type glycerol-3-phosphate transport system permease component
MSLAYFLALSAFPIEAMAIPNFILLRNIGLLNTVWALALPTAVNGYFIYLLKSAFDAVPPNWFEQAQMDGADEWQLFLNVALPAALPMVAVVALYGFMFAWSNFLWAMIVGQSRELWTMPVLIFTMHNWNTAPSLVSAALVIMTIPPLVVFLVANRTVQRGLTAKSW